MHHLLSTEKRRRGMRKRRERESGSALIPVLALIFACSMIVSAVITLSQTGAYTMATHLKLQKSMYLCEGMLNRVQWLITAERARGTNTSMRDFDYADYSYDRFLPDGVVHEADYHGTPMRFTITDAAAGLDFSSRFRRTTLAALTQDASADSTYLDAVQTLQERIGDYVDADDATVGDSLEEDDFAQENKRPLPRNAEFQYREELFFIPGFTDLFPPDRDGRLSGIRIVVPETLAVIRTQTQVQGRLQTRTSPLLPQTPNIFGAGDLYLKNALRLEDDELAIVKEAILNYQNDRIPFSDSLESTLMLKLNSLSWTASGTYAIRIEGGEGAGPVRRLAAAYTAPDNPSGPSDSVIRFLEWIFF